MISKCTRGRYYFTVACRAFPAANDGIFFAFTLFIMPARGVRALCAAAPYDARRSQTGNDYCVPFLQGLLDRCENGINGFSPLLSLIKSALYVYSPPFN